MAPFWSRAAAPDLEVVWSGPSECARASEVESAARRALLASQDLDPGRFVVELVAHPGGYRLEFSGQVGEDSSRRILEVTSCDEAEDAAVLLVVLALDPAGASRLVEEDEVGAEAESTEQDGASVSGAGAATRVQAGPAGGASGGDAGSGEAIERDGATSSGGGAKRRALQGALFAGVGFALQSELVSPRIAPGMGALVGARFGGWRASAKASWFPEQSGLFGPVDDLELALSGWSVRIMAAHLWTLGVLRWGPQLDFQMQSVVGRREVASGSLSESIDYVSLGGGGLIEAPLLPWLTLAGSVGMLVPLHRPAFIVEPFGVVFQPGELSFCAALDVIFSVPLKKSAAGGQ